jgi:hypothetical protein
MSDHSMASFDEVYPNDFDGEHAAIGAEVGPVDESGLRAAGDPAPVAAPRRRSSGRAGPTRARSKLRGLADPGDGLGDDDENDAGRPFKKSVSTQVVRLAEHNYEFGCSTDGAVFGVEKDGPNIARSLRGGRLGLRAALATAFMDITGKAASAGALADALLVLEGRCRKESPVPLFHRVAPWGDDIVVDLGQPDGQVVHIDSAGWRILKRSPVTFKRSELTMPLPDPVHGGYDLLARPVGTISPASWPLALGWLVAALLPELPHPIVLCRGEHGSGKTSTATAMSDLIDPTSVPMRSVPRDLETWAVSASASWVVALDNLSSIAEWLSDALCRASTGEGNVRRKLYTDDDVSVIAFRRAVIMTAIDAGSLKGDLADRLLPITLEPVSPDRRRTEADVAAQWVADHPAMLGALYDLVAGVLRELPSVELGELPRMADFARVLAALDRVDPDPAVNRVAAYKVLHNDIARDVIEGDPFASKVCHLARARGQWSGTAGELLAELRPPNPKPKDWPTNPRACGGALRRIGPALRVVGITMEYRRTESERTVHISADEATTS